MKRLIPALYVIAVCLILGIAVCIDWLADIPYGLIIIILAIGTAGALVLIANGLEDAAADRNRRECEE